MMSFLLVFLKYVDIQVVCPQPWMWVLTRIQITAHVRLKQILIIGAWLQQFMWGGGEYVCDHSARSLVPSGNHRLPVVLLCFSSLCYFGISYPSTWVCRPIKSSSWSNHSLRTAGTWVDTDVNVLSFLISHFTNCLHPALSPSSHCCCSLDYSGHSWENTQCLTFSCFYMRLWLP